MKFDNFEISAKEHSLKLEDGAVQNLCESEQFQTYMTDESLGTPVQNLQEATIMGTLLENQRAYCNAEHNAEIGSILTEATDAPNGSYGTNYSGQIHDGSANSAYDTTAIIPKLMMPLLRRMIPEQIFQHFYKVQPMTGPTGLIMAMRSMYAGTQASPLSRGNAVIIAVQESAEQVAQGSTYTPLLDTRSLTFDASSDSHLTFSGGATGFVRHVEYQFLVVEVLSGTVSAGETVSAASATNPLTVASVLPLEAGYRTILSNWDSPYLPNYQSYDGSNTQSMIGLEASLPQMSIEFEKVQVTANSNKIGATFPIELAQDLRASTGLNIQAELVRVMKEQLNAAKNREAIDVMNALAKGMTAYDVNSNTQGRWHMERIRTLRMRLDFLSQDIFQRSRRGAGNKVLVSPNVLVLLNQLPDFQVATTQGSLQFGKSRAGTLGNLEIYVDHFSRTEYMTMAYVGGSSFDGGLFYAPYVEAMMGEANDQVFGKRIGFLSRYALGRNPYGPENYYTYQPISGVGNMLGLS